MDLSPFTRPFRGNDEVESDDHKIAPGLYGERDARNFAPTFERAASVHDEEKPDGLMTYE